MKHIIIQDTQLISNIDYNKTDLINNKNCIIMPSLYFIKETKNMNYINKFKFKKNIFSDIIKIKDKDKFIYDFNKKYFIAIKLKPLSKLKCNNFYLLVDIFKNIKLSNREVIKINEKFLIFYKNRLVELNENILKKDFFTNKNIEIINIDLKKEKIKKIPKYILFINNLKIKNNFIDFDKYIWITSISLLLIATFNFEKFIYKKQSNDNFSSLATKYNLPKNYILLENIYSNIKKYKEYIEEEKIYLENLKKNKINKRWKTINIDIKNKSMKVKK